MLRDQVKISERSKIGYGSIRAPDGSRSIEARVCPKCGYWFTRHWAEDPSLHESASHADEMTEIESVGYLHGCLNRLNPTDIAKLAFTEIRSYLFHYPDDKYFVNPWELEQAIASGFRNIGYDSIWTGKGPDGGADVLLFGRDESDVILVDVKRFQKPENKISIDMVKTLVGTLMDRDVKRGIVLSNTGYSKEAYKYTQRNLGSPYVVEVQGSEDLFRILRSAESSLEITSCQDVPEVKHVLENCPKPIFGSHKLSIDALITYKNNWGDITDFKIRDSSNKYFNCETLRFDNKVNEQGIQRLEEAVNSNIG